MTIAPRPPISGTAPGSMSRLQGQDTLANNTVSIDFDSGSYDNKIVTYTANASITLSSTTEGHKSIVIKSNDGTTYNLTWVNVDIGLPPTTVSSTDGILIRFYDDGTNLRVL